MKALNWVLAVMLGLFTVVQYNDPDPILWMLMYGYVAVICALAALGRWNKQAILAGLVGSIAWAFLLLPEFVNWIKMGCPNIAKQMKAETPYVEFTREFLGLVICVVVLSWQLWLSKRKQQEK
jgi:hypothetical protein